MTSTETRPIPLSTPTLPSKVGQFFLGPFIGTSVLFAAVASGWFFAGVFGSSLNGGVAGEMQAFFASVFGSSLDGGVAGAMQALTWWSAAVALVAAGKGINLISHHTIGAGFRSGKKLADSMFTRSPRRPRNM
jgi:hypothetical protein